MTPNPALRLHPATTPRRPIALAWIAATVLAWSSVANGDVDSIEPNELSYFGGTTFVVEGTGLPTSLISVLIDGTACTVTFASSTLIEAIAPQLPPGGPYDLEVWQFTGLGNILRESVPGAIAVSGPLSVDDVTPSAVMPVGSQQTVTITGAGFTDATVFTLVSSSGTYPLDPKDFVSASEQVAHVLFPLVPEGVYSIEAEDAFPGGPPVVATLPDALIVGTPLAISLVTPSEISYLGQTTVRVFGSGFTTNSIVSLDGDAIPTTFISSTELHCVPPHSFDTPVTPLLSVAVTDPVTGFDSVGDGLRYRGPLQMLSTDQPVVLAGQPDYELNLYGDGFMPGLLVEIADQVHVNGGSNPTYMEAFFPTLPIGVHDIKVTATIELAPGAGPTVVTAVLENGITVAPNTAPSITAAEPATVCSTAETTIIVIGENFIPETEVRVGGQLLQGAVVGVDGTDIMGVVPAGLPAGPLLVEVSDFRGGDTASDVLSSSNECPSLLPPDEFEAARAYGVARFTWNNPVEYDFIEVFDLSGALVATLSGDTTSFEMAALTNAVELVFQGKTSDAISAGVLAIARPHACEYPPPMSGAVQPGELDMTLRGGHAAATVVRCGLGSPQPPTAEGRAPQSERLGTETVGWIQTASDYAEFLVQRDQLTTGFVLEQPVDRLEVRAFYQRVAGDFGVSLRARLVHVFPNDGFVDEFTMPDPFIGADKRYHSLTYYRATQDVGTSGAQPCLGADGLPLRIPAGEYRLEFYTVGGDPEIPYYIFADDPRDEESFIQGVPCPPYPLVEIRDLTGLRTLPNITEIELLFPNVDPATGQVMVFLFAHGVWFDFDGTPYSIDTQCDSVGVTFDMNGDITTFCKDPPYQETDAFVYCWTLRWMEPARCKLDKSQILARFPDWGCYKIEVTVIDKACGTSRTIQEDIILVPQDRDLCDSDPFSFRFPAPDPGGINGMIGLNPAPGGGLFQGERPLDFRVLVVPDCYCVGQSCPAPVSDNLEFRLGLRFTGPGGQPATIGLTDPIEGEDLCLGQFEGPKYFHVSFPDLGAVASHPLVGTFDPSAVFLQGRVIAGGTTYPWRSIGDAMSIVAPPPALGSGMAWTGHFDAERGSYDFTVQSGPDALTTFELPPTVGESFGIVDAGIPATDGNFFDAGFTASLRMGQAGSWFDQKGKGLTGGDVMDNLVGGAPDIVDGVELPSIPDVPDSLPTWEYCSSETLFKHEFSSTLFESILYAGFIGPIPVNIWASVGLGFGFTIKSFLHTEVSPFAAVSGGDYYNLDFAVKSDITISIPCQIAADILAGIASIGIRLVPVATFEVIPYFNLAYNPGGPVSTQSGVFHDSYMDISMEVEGCIQTLVLGEQCVTVNIPLVEGWEFMGESDDPFPPLSSCLPPQPGSAAPAAGPGVTEVSVVEAVNRPVSILSPDGSTVVDLWVTEDSTGGQLAKIVVTEDSVRSVPLEANILDNEYFMEPSAAFISDTEIVLVGTGTPNGWSRLPTPIDPANPLYLVNRNINAAHAEILLARLTKVSGSWEIDMSNLSSIADPDASLPEDRRVDGRASVAGDAVNGDAMVAWVRYSDDLLVEGAPPFGQLYLPELSTCGFAICPVPTPPFVIEPDITRSTIAVRRVDTLGTLPGVDFDIISEPGINIQPSIAFSPSGDKAICVWVHDPTNPDLIEFNRGRFLKYAIYDRATDTWSLPSDAVEFPDDYPALLEPSIVLSDDDNGILAFTALSASNTSLRDTGLGGGSRLLFVSRLVDGVFEEPIEIRGRCAERVYAWRQVAFLVPNKEWVVDQGLEYEIALPEYILTWQEFGAVGTHAGTGNVGFAAFDEVTSQWSAGTNLFPDGTVMSNVTGTPYRGGVHSVHYQAGLSDPELALLGPVPVGYQIDDTPLWPDPAVECCRLTDPMAGPGVFVPGDVTVRNLGFASTAYDANDESVLAVELVFVNEDGTEQVMQTLPLDVLEIQESTTVPFSIEMPLDPVVLVARLVTGGIDRDVANNERRCFFGAPAPYAFGCDVGVLQIPTVDDRFRVRLLWENAAPYDAVLLYRDGAMLHRFPGDTTSFVDVGVAEGFHTYEVRGVIAASYSAKTLLECEVVTPPAPTFLRGDANRDGTVNVADGVYHLEYLFNGGDVPPCFASADTNFDGTVNIADGVYLLAYLFQGGAAPLPPFPDCASSSAVSDATLGCVLSGCD